MLLIEASSRTRLHYSDLCTAVQRYLHSKSAQDAWTSFRCNVGAFGNGEVSFWQDEVSLSWALRLFGVSVIFQKPIACRNTRTIDSAIEWLREALLIGSDDYAR